MKKNLLMSLCAGLLLFACDRININKFKPGSQGNPVSVSIAPATAVIDPGATAQFTAMLSYDNGLVADVTSSAVWNAAGSAAPGATPGSFIGAATAGTAVISCSRDGITSTATGGDALLVVNGVVSITVIPSQITVSPNVAVAYGAIATYLDSSTADITAVAAWNVVGDATAGATPGSAVAGSSAGAAVIDCSYQSVSAAATGGDGELIIAPDIFVATAADGGSDSNLGTSDSPYATLEYALFMASPGVSIRIAQGDYYPPATLALTIDGVSLLGGYAADWTRDVVNNRARIFDTSIAGGDPQAAVSCGNAITGLTVIEGLEMYGSTVFTGNRTAAIYTEGNPVISSCLLNGGTGLTTSYGVYSTATADMTIIDCQINGGGGAGASYGVYSTSATGNLLLTGTSIQGGAAANASYGLYPYATGETIIDNSVIDGGSGNYSYGLYQPGVASSQMIIKNSFVSGGTGTTYSSAMLFQNNAQPSPRVYNNIIVGNTGAAGADTVICIHVGQGSQPFIANNTLSPGHALTNAYGINTAYSGRPSVYNNIIALTSGLVRLGIREAYSGGDPIAVRNNFIHNATALYYDYDTTTMWTTISAMEAGLTAEGVGASSNSDLDPLLVGGSDYRLQPLSPAVGAGLNGLDNGWVNFPLDASSTFPIDHDGMARPSGGAGAWAIGAFE